MLLTGYFCLIFRTAGYLYVPGDFVNSMRICDFIFFQGVISKKEKVLSWAF